MTFRDRDRRCKLTESAEDDAVTTEWRRETVLESDLAFQAALDSAIAAGLEVSSTSLSTVACAKNPIIVAHDWY